MKSYKFQIGDRVYIGKTMLKGTIIKIDSPTQFSCSVRWDDYDHVQSGWAGHQNVKGVSLILIQNAIDKLDDIL